MHNQVLLALVPVYLSLTSALAKPLAQPIPAGSGGYGGGNYGSGSGSSSSGGRYGDHSDPYQNPRGDPRYPTGSYENPAAVHYDPNRQPQQVAHIQQNPYLQQPYPTARSQGEDPGDNRRMTFAKYQNKAPQKGDWREDQPMAMMAHYGQPGTLSGAPESEQRHQSAAGNAAGRAVNAPGSGGQYVQQVVPKTPVNAQPRYYPERQKRDLEMQGILVARDAASKAYTDVLDNLDVLFARSVSLDVDDIMSILYSRVPEPDPELDSNDMVTREAVPQYSPPVFARSARVGYVAA